MAFTGDQRSIQATYASVGELVKITRQGAPLEGTTAGDNEFGDDIVMNAPFFASEINLGANAGDVKGNFGAAHKYVPQVGDVFSLQDKDFTISVVSPYRVSGVTLYIKIEAGYS